jgi:hypothetical protein
MDPFQVIATFCGFEDGSLFVVAVVSAALVLATSGRRSSRRCSRCSQLNREEAIYCAQCGKKLSE